MIKESKYKKDLIQAVNRLAFDQHITAEDKRKDYELLMTFIDNRL